MFEPHEELGDALPCSQNISLPERETLGSSRYKPHPPDLAGEGRGDTYFPKSHPRHDGVIRLSSFIFVFLLILLMQFQHPLIHLETKLNCGVATLPGNNGVAGGVGVLGALQILLLTK